jgi:serine/threonine protein kinase/WD40 repeat protein
MNAPSLVEDIFLAALEKGTPAERAAYLSEACKDDQDLRRRVDRLLEAHPRAGGFLEDPVRPAGERTTAFIPTGEQVGSVLAGRYKLLEQIGEGGMGTVWVAEQIEPVRRRVALKLVKPGMDSKTVLSRFEAERQALALMDHPHIAKVLDGGTTENGRPFFVMEYVKGVPFTRYCDEARLSVAQRLALFVPVCQAVQHAHQKGIIHRDLKPSNILICLYDGQPVPKVIDFGLAKAMHQPLTERSLYTAHGVMMGTPLYMSPEQAEFNNLDVDTRTDIYALGVILYELLTGTTPLEKQRFQEAAWQEMLRLIKEEEPPRPSVRLSGNVSLPSLAAQRQLEPVKLTRLVRGELDWIVMKCLEKERSRRYDTANGLARDVERYLADEVVEARPTSAGYRLRKFTRKYRVGIATAAAFAVLLLASAGVSSLLALKARLAERIAEERQMEAEANAQEAQFLSSSLKTDLDLAELNTDPRVGVLRLTRTLQDLAKGQPETVRATDRENLLDRRRALREFLTFTVLAGGQRYAPLLAPITHDGLAIKTALLTPTGDRLLTLGEDQTARLWEGFTGQPLAILRGADEKVIDTGLSPDGATAFTQSADGVVRLWEPRDGSFRALIDLRPGGFFTATKIQLSDDRVLTYPREATPADYNITIMIPKVPVELWDAKSGRSVARLGLPGEIVTLQPTYLTAAVFQFFGNDHWIAAFNSQAGYDQSIHVFSAETGRSLANLKHDKKYSVGRFLPNQNTTAHTVATVSGATPEREGASGTFIHLWDTTTWQLLSVTGIKEFESGETGNDYQLINNDLIVMAPGGGNSSAFRLPNDTPTARLPGGMPRFSQDLVLLEGGQLFDTRTWQRLQPPKGRKYHPEIVRFAPDGRFIASEALDTTAEKVGFMGREPSFYQAPFGWVLPEWGLGYGYAMTLPRLPPPDRLDIAPDLLELWAQVAIRGELGHDGAFVKWDEPTWEKKRQELASKPSPIGDFPFPGHLAVDRLHWLRQAYMTASEANKPGLAKQLLDRAEATGDKAEALHWITILNPKPVPTKAAELKPNES